MRQIKVVSLPFFLKIGKGELQNIGRIFQDYGLTPENIILITTKHLCEKYTGLIKAKEKYFIQDSTLNEAERVIEKIRREKNALILGFGGGKVIDLTKYVATKKKIKYISIPTALSNDGIYSPVAVLSKNNKKKRFGADIPLGIIIDLEIVEKAPISTIRAGIGDLISKISALKDWDLANKTQGESINYFAYALSHVAVQLVLNTKKISLRSEKFLRNLAYSLIICGLAMEIAKSSRPCSGGEHNFSHSLNYLYPEKSKPHGVQVAFGTLITELLRGEEIEQLKTFFKKVGLPTTTKEFGFSKGEILEAMKLSRKIRRRYTIFSKAKSNEKFNSVVERLSKVTPPKKWD